MEKRRDSFFLTDKKQKKEKSDQRKLLGSDNKNEGNNSVKKKRQESYNKNRDGLEHGEEQESKGKKPFDKNAYRFKKYSKKYKLEQWEEKRKKKLLHNYYKELKHESTAGIYKSKNFDEDITDSNMESVGRFVRHPDLLEKEEAKNKNMRKKNKQDPYFKAKQQYDKIKQNKLEKRQEMERAKEERNVKLQEYKKKKQERFKKLSKKNKKGQPVMSGRLELLLEKIQKD